MITKKTIFRSLGSPITRVSGCLANTKMLVSKGLLRIRLENGTVIKLYSEKHRDGKFEETLWIMCNDHNVSVFENQFDKRPEYQGNRRISNAVWDKILVVIKNGCKTKNLIR